MRRGRENNRADGVGGLRGQRVADKAAAPPRSATQSNEWAINSGQWAACVAPLKSAGARSRRSSPAPRPELQTDLEPPPLPDCSVSEPGAGGWGRGASRRGLLCTERGARARASRAPELPGSAAWSGRASWAGGPGRCGNPLRASADPADLDRDRADRSPGPWVVSRSPGGPEPRDPLTPASTRSPPPPCPSPIATTR